MSWNAILGIACIVSFSFPVAVIIANRYYTHRSLFALLVYYSMVLLDNIFAEGIIHVSSLVSSNVSILDNYLDVPLMMTALLFFCPGKQKQKSIRILTYAFLVYEIVIAVSFGFSKQSVTYVIGPGICLVLIYTTYLFVRQVKFSIYHSKNHGRMIMLTAILFAYATYALIYFFHYIQKTPYKADVQMLYYITCIVSCVLMAIGLQLMRRRMKELKSLRVTRKELAVFFGQAGLG
jgi:NADH:ubiquinone oxidoreductase subunit K